MHSQRNLDVVFYYAELGNPYLPLIERATQSCLEVMPYARRVLLTPTPSQELNKHFDKVVDLSPNMKTTRESLCYDRARVTVSWQGMTKNDTIYSDPDIEFQKPIPFDGSFDVGLLWRKRKPDQPINTGLVLATPGSPMFWARYGAIVENLPAKLRGWWCDQLAFNVLMGTYHEAGETIQAYDARVKLFDWLEACAPPEKLTGQQPWALHQKGHRKWREMGIETIVEIAA